MRCCPNSVRNMLRYGAGEKSSSLQYDAILKNRVSHAIISDEFIKNTFLFNFVL